jgi:hypothetical protein
MTSSNLAPDFRSGAIPKSELRATLPHSLADRLTDALAGLLVEQQHFILTRHQLAELVAQGSHLGAVAVVHLGYSSDGSCLPIGALMRAARSLPGSDRFA